MNEWNGENKRKRIHSKPASHLLSPTYSCEDDDVDVTTLDQPVRLRPIEMINEKSTHIHIQLSKANKREPELEPEPEPKPKPN